MATNSENIAKEDLIEISAGVGEAEVEPGPTGSLPERPHRPPPGRESIGDVVYKQLTRLGPVGTPGGVGDENGIPLPPPGY